MKLLLADDNADIQRAISVILKKNQYQVDTVDNGNDAYDYALIGNYDGIILDIMMPGIDGLEVLRKIRKEGICAPVLLLTAKGELDDRILGLDSGADDYLPKPFAVSELLARVRAMLRRRDTFVPDIKKFHSVILNRSTYEIQYQEKSVRLVSREFQVFELLMEHENMILATDIIMERVWGWDSDVEVSIIWVTISNIRKKLMELNAPLNIRAVRGVGYKLEDMICERK